MIDPCCRPMHWYQPVKSSYIFYNYYFNLKLKTENVVFIGTTYFICLFQCISSWWIYTNFKRIIKQLFVSFLKYNYKQVLLATFAIYLCFILCNVWKESYSKYFQGHPKSKKEWTALETWWISTSAKWSVR
jgi:hypothetical protein